MPCEALKRLSGRSSEACSLKLAVDPREREKTSPVTSSGTKLASEQRRRRVQMEAKGSVWMGAEKLMFGRGLLSNQVMVEDMSKYPSPATHSHPTKQEQWNAPLCRPIPSMNSEAKLPSFVSKGRDARYWGRCIFFTPRLKSSPHKINEHIFFASSKVQEYLLHLHLDSRPHKSWMTVSN